MKFIDEAKIEVKAGKGGAGACNFRREKYVPYGGPDGGNGGAGGSVILKADKNKHTLLDLKMKPIWHAPNGKPGGPSRKDGRGGEDLIIHVPVGTQILEKETDNCIADLDVLGSEFTIASGGRGGKGNAFFKSATNRAPEHSQPGEEGEEGIFMLSLKLVADVGLVGFPNAGKSTLISRISAAKPKIADYPFTTLEPNLGVVDAGGGRTFVVADIPGIIPDAHQGKGLGIQFLKHIERTATLAFIIDPLQIDTEGNPVAIEDSYQTLRKELGSYSSELSKKPHIVALSKADAVSDEEATREAMGYFEKLNVPCFVISSVSGEGLDLLIRKLADEVTAFREQSELQPQPEE